MARMKFIMVPIGSAGDVHPFIWIARLLQQRGHEVVFLAQEAVRKMPEAAGLKTIPWGNLQRQEDILRNPDIWHPSKAIKLILEHMPEWARESIPMIRSELEGGEGRSVMIAGALAFGARVIAERWDVPLLTIHLQPTVFMSAVDTPVMMAKGEWLPKLPRFLRQLFFDFVNWRVDGLLGPTMGQVRESVGLPAGRVIGLMRSYWNSPDGVLCTFPEWFAPKASDWPPQAVVTRFPLYDESTDRPLDASLEQFMSAGEPPIVITPGSANAHGHSFIRESLLACQRIGKRALVVTRFPETVGPLPAGSASFEYVPFGRIFLRAAAVVHHGGVGTTAQCLAAGVPQFLMPMAHDQPDNAARIKKMECGDYLYPGKFKARRIAKKLSLLLASDAIKSACAEGRRRIKEQMSESQMGELIEQLSERAIEKRAGAVAAMH
ncbi:MAG TPA: nucleotide disphospho-sugar-binding domain-containing protein [Phycisphaerae bacterium]|jgi:UDP:flavonoid glycosyltransferase YjiC (YdhE family)